MSKKRGYEAKPRNTNLRKRKSIVLLAAEGKNKTETLYFKSIPSATHVIRFAPGNYTDPINMVHGRFIAYPVFVTLIYQLFLACTACYYSEVE